MQWRGGGACGDDVTSHLTRPCCVTSPLPLSLSLSLSFLFIPFLFGCCSLSWHVILGMMKIYSLEFLSRSISERRRNGFGDVIGARVSMAPSSGGMRNYVSVTHQGLIGHRCVRHNEAKRRRKRAEKPDESWEEAKRGEDEEEEEEEEEEEGWCSNEWRAVQRGAWWTTRRRRRRSFPPSLVLVFISFSPFLAIRPTGSMETPR